MGFLLDPEENRSLAENMQVEVIRPTDEAAGNQQFLKVGSERKTRHETSKPGTSGFVKGLTKIL